MSYSKTIAAFATFLFALSSVCFSQQSVSMTDYSKCDGNDSIQVAKIAAAGPGILCAYAFQRTLWSNGNLSANVWYHSTSDY